LEKHTFLSRDRPLALIMTLNFRWFASRLSIWFAMAVLLVVATRGGSAQSLPPPTREQLLNGLRLVLWNTPAENTVYLKLRIHSGAAFDLAGKAGMMALLSDALFPDPTTREYFTEELGGKVEVTNDFDTINITLTGRASEFERIVELLRTAVVNIQLTPELVPKLRESRIKIVKDLGISPASQADRAIAWRVFGNYPYGRPVVGSPETLARIERPDLMQARDRFLNPNNATLVIIGGVEERRAMRALKQLLGGWRKSDVVVPPTFRQPEPPDTRTQIIDQPAAESTEVRLAVRGLARSDKDAPTAQVLALVAREMWLAARPELSKSAFFVRHEAHTLPGLFIMGASVSEADAPVALAGARKVLQSLSKDGGSQALLDRAKNEAVAELNKQTERPQSLADLWLDGETFQLGSVDDRLKQLKGITIADLKRVAERLFSESQIATVALGKAERLKPALERAGKVEVLTTTAGASSDPTAGPIKKQ
jgi:zinc protease